MKIAAAPLLSPDDAAQQKSMLRFITCGSVDDGKSTLIGRMLHESHMIFDDQLNSLRSDSRKFGTAGEEIDFALLVDGLSAEREQGITIDVAYRYFSTAKRKFIVADMPGHEQYTRNMATGASTADLAIILADARKGILIQTRRHSFIVSLLGIRHVVLAVNKMDLAGYDRAVFEKIEADFRAMSAELGFETIQAIPLSALKGDNITSRSEAMKWYSGPSVFEYLENIDATPPERFSAFRMPVQWVNRPSADFRGFAGEIAAGSVKVGDMVMALPSHKTARVARIVTHDGDLQEAQAGKAVTLTLDSEIDISRGCVLAAADAPCEVSTIFKTRILWMSEKAMVSGRAYTFRQGMETAQCTLAPPSAAIDVHSFAQRPARALDLNDIGLCDIYLDRPVAFEPYRSNRAMGSFILVDRVSCETVAMGVIEYALRRSENIIPHAMDLGRDAHARLTGQKPCALWMTGVSGAGKSTIANALEKQLFVRGRHTVILDGDNIRKGLNRDLGFTEADRAENIRRTAEVARLMVDAGLIVIVSLISPFAAERQLAREIIGEDAFIEIYIDTPLAVAEARDVKGPYKKARAGEIPNFTGINSPYEAPEHADLVLKTTESDTETLAEAIVSKLVEKEFLKDG
jgi:bifunctional enzyme CysN/CysC